MKLGEQLKEVFRAIGKEFAHLQFPNDKSSGYYMSHPFHALRHIGALHCQQQ